MKTRVSRCCCVALGAALTAVVAGCNSPTGIALQLVGKAVDAVETQKLGEELVGKAPAAADTKLGAPVDTWQQVHGPTEWRVYSVSLDPLGKQKYVVQTSRGSIVAVAKVKMDSSGIELARKLLYDQKVSGKSPKECEAALDLGPPLASARSRSTNQLAQLYDAKMVKGVGSPQYCRLRFDANDRCSEVALVNVSASTNDDLVE